MLYPPRRKRNYLTYYLFPFTYYLQKKPPPSKRRLQQSWYHSDSAENPPSFRTRLCPSSVTGSPVRVYSPCGDDRLVSRYRGDFRRLLGGEWSSFDRPPRTIPFSRQRLSERPWKLGFPFIAFICMCSDYNIFLYLLSSR